MKRIVVKRQILEDMAEAAGNTFPMEFIAMVGSRERNDIIDELVIIPAIFGESHSLLYSSQIPFDKKIVGSVHSHPSPSNYPSRADLESFRKLGKIHFIVSQPFTLESISAFDNNGKKVLIEAIE